MTEPSLLRMAANDYRGAWRELALAGLAWKVIAFVLLTPLVSVLFRVLIAASGKSILVDQDILYFFLGPVGWICFVAVGATWLGILALEQAALLGVLCAAANGSRLGVVGSLRFALANCRRVILATGRILAFLLLVLLPFLGVIGLIYLGLLREHDINWYLKEKPPEFWAAVSLAGVVVAALLVVLLRLTTNWLFALPLVLFEDVAAADALPSSRDRAKGHRWTLLLWLVAWAVATLLVSLLASSLVLLLGRLLVPQATGSLWLLAFAIGIALVAWTVVNLALNLLSTTSFAAILFNLYREFGGEAALDAKTVAAQVRAERGTRFQVTRSRLAIALLAGVVLAIGIGIAAIRTVRLEDHTDVTAHRGASSGAPENTLASVELAIEQGADWIEIDVQETADGEVVVFHDSDFMKVAGEPLKIWQAEASDLEAIDIGGWFGPDFNDQRVPKLADVLDLCKGKAGVNIELKYYGHDQQLEQRVIDLVEARGMESEVVIMSLKLDAVEKMKTLRPDWKVGLLMSVSAGDLKGVDLDFLAVNASFADRPFIRRAHRRGREVYVWTVNDAPTMSAMIGRGVDSLITDKPALARSVLEQRAALSPAERLLLELATALGVSRELGEL